MRQPNEICLTGNNSTFQSTSTHETGIFSWTTVVHIYNAIPGEVTPCNNICEAKMYTAVLLAVMSMCFLPLMAVAWFLYDYTKKGGSK